MSAQPLLGAKHRKVVRVRKLLRRRELRDAEGVFVVEGEIPLTEALRAHASIESVYCDATWQSHLFPQLERAGIRVHRLGDGVIERVGSTATPQPVLAVIRQPDHVIADCLANKRILVLADVRDPGNAGTMMRTAEAAGFGSVLFADNSVDRYNPKVIRASAGAIFHTTHIAGLTTLEAIALLKAEGVRVYGAAVAGRAYREVSLVEPIALVMGNEAHGLTSESEAACDELISVPQRGRAESLNVSMAAAVLCFAIADAGASWHPGRLTESEKSVPEEGSAQ